MANTIKNTAVASQGNVLSTELNNLASSARSNKGTTFDNSVSGNRFQTGQLRINLVLDGAPASGTISVYMLRALDGTNFQDGSSSVAPTFNSLIDVIELHTSAAQQLVSVEFPLPPCKVAFILVNDASHQLSGTGSVVELYTWTPEVQ